jgi:hypothetical protein
LIRSPDASAPSILPCEAGEGDHREAMVEGADDVGGSSKAPPSVAASRGEDEVRTRGRVEDSALAICEAARQPIPGTD